MFFPETPTYDTFLVGLSSHPGFYTSQWQFLFSNNLRSNAAHSALSPNQWQTHLLPTSQPEIRKIELLYFKQDSCLLGIKFYGPNDEVLLSLGSIDAEDFQEDKMFARSFVELSAGDRIV